MTPWQIVWRTSALGDFLLTLPLLRALAATGRQLCLITRPAYLDLLPADSRPQAFMAADDAGLATLFMASPLSAVALSCRVRPLFRGQPPVPGAAALFAGADVFLFMAPDPVLEKNLAQLRIGAAHWLEPRPARSPHAAVHYLVAAGFPVPADLLTTPQLAPQRDAAAKGGCLWLHPGSGSPRKNAPPRFFAESAAAWQRQHRQPVMVSFGEADRGVREPMLAELASAGVAFEVVENVGLGELRELLARRAGEFLGNDSGVSHLAAALGIPTTAVFVASDPAIWRPLGQVTVRQYPATSGS